MQTGLTYPLIIPQPRVAFQGTLRGRWPLHNLEDSSETAEDLRAGGVPGDNLLSLLFFQMRKLRPSSREIELTWEGGKHTARLHAESQNLV